MIRTLPTQYPVKDAYLIEVPATTESYLVKERLPFFSPYGTRPDVYWGGLPGPSWEVDFMTHFGNMVIEPLAPFTLTARRFPRDREFWYMARDYAEPSLTLAQVLALSRAALHDLDLMRVLGDKLNLFFVPDQQGQVLAVTGLFEPRYVLLSAGPTDVGSHHSQNYVITPG